MQLHEKYGKDGLAVIMLSTEPDSLVKPYVGDNDIPFIVATAAESALKEYNVRGYPSSFLIDGTGTVVWSGHPMALRDSQVAEVMKTVELFKLPEVPRSLKSAKASFESEKFGDAAKKAKTRLASKSASREDKAAAQMILDTVREVAEKKLAQVETALSNGDYPRAFETLKYIQVRFSGLDVSKKAKARESELKKDPDIKKELTAFKMLEKYRFALSRAKTRAEKKKWIPAFEAFAIKYEGTHAARRATVARSTGH